jgi:hypothetical protein
MGGEEYFPLKDMEEGTTFRTCLAKVYAGKNTSNEKLPPY